MSSKSVTADITDSKDAINVVGGGPSLGSSIVLYFDHSLPENDIVCLLERVKQAIIQDLG